MARARTRRRIEGLLPALLLMAAAPLGDVRAAAQAPDAAPRMTQLQSLLDQAESAGQDARAAKLRTLITRLESTHAARVEARDRAIARAEQRRELIRERAEARRDGRQDRREARRDGRQDRRDVRRDGRQDRVQARVENRHRAREDRQDDRAMRREHVGGELSEIMEDVRETRSSREIRGMRRTSGQPRRSSSLDGSRLRIPRFGEDRTIRRPDDHRSAVGGADAKRGSVRAAQKRAGHAEAGTSRGGTDAPRKR